MSDDLRQIMDDILALHAEEDEIKESRKRFYADAQTAGFNKSALGLAIRTIRARQKRETPEALEKQSTAESYVDQYDSLAHVHVRESYPERISRPAATIPHGELSSPAAPESEHVDRSASAPPHSAIGEPAISSTAGDAGTGPALCDEAALAATTGQLSGAGTGSAASTGAPISGLAEANAIAARALQPSGPKVERAVGIDIEIPAFLRRTAPGNHPSFGDQA